MLELNHPIQATPPFAVYYNEGKAYLEVEEVIDKIKLRIFLPPNLPRDFQITIGKNASLNIPEALVLDDYLTSKDKEFIEIAQELGIHDYCLSYVESAEDINALLALAPDANIIAKIESVRGLRFVKTDYPALKEKVRLMAARGDLFIELDYPHEILNALKTIILADKNAIAASRLLQSIITETIPACADLCDLGFLLNLGYKSFLFGDEVCSEEQTLKSAIGILQAILADYHQ